MTRSHFIKGVRGNRAKPIPRVFYRTLLAESMLACPASRVAYLNLPRFHFYNKEACNGSTVNDT